ncbi:MAG TPA: response regulator transcription factor [Candidatus Paceibacterota bacterium]|jgi:DNA-binding response OmpR family regulator|nr:response regulator transcription factor [Candidatus Paceibacterota bacterium]
MNLLIIEDDRDIRLLLKQAFVDEGFIVDVAEDGLVGSQKARMNNYDLILLDIGLPYKNGREVCADIRAAKKGARIVMLSVAQETSDKVELLNAGADDYITKPFVWSELLAHVRAVLRRPPVYEHVILEVKGVVLDSVHHTVKRSGKDIYLTPKEFTFLEYLMRNQGKMLTRMSILEHVWGVDADPFTNTVDTHILNLRKKLGDKKTKSLICTVSGIGYRMA